MPSSTYGKLFLILSVCNLMGGLIGRILIKKFVSTVKIRILGFVLSIIGCILLLISSKILLSQPEIKVVYYVLLIFGPMAIYLMGHSMVVPMTLRHALEDYNKVTGSAGSIFGALYYLTTASICFVISMFHSYTINNFAYLFAVLLFISLVLFYNIIKNKGARNTQKEFLNLN
jgi:hypothetical protein